MDTTFRAFDIYAWFVPALACTLVTIALMLPIFALVHEGEGEDRKRTFAMAPRQQLSRLWLSTRVSCFGLGTLIITTSLAFEAARSRGDFMHGYLELATHSVAFSLSTLISAGVSLLACAALTTRHNRGRVLRWLGHIGSGR